MYKFMCDFVHPNFGSNLLISSGQLGEGIIDPPLNEKIKIIKQILIYIDCLLDFLSEQHYRYANIGIILEDYIEKTTLENATITNIFHIESAHKLISGNGSNKETAISFPKARTHTECMLLLYEYLRNQGIEVIPDDKGMIKYSDYDFQEGFVYDIFNTKKGKLWFKMPIPKH